MTFGTVVLSLFDGLFGAVFGGLFAAWIALHTAKQAIAANAAAQDRDRALSAALRFREFVVSYVSMRGQGEFTMDAFNRLLQDLHIAMKSAQYARFGDSEFAEWITWAHREISAGLADSRTDFEHTAWLGDIAKMIENRLFDGAALERPERPANVA